MKRNFLRSLLAFAIAALLLSFTRFADKANYAGNWSLNESKSVLGDVGGRFIARKIKVNQEDDAITIAKTAPSRDGGQDETRIETLTFDGKTVETTATRGSGTSKRKSVIKWSADGQSFVITYAVVFEGNNGPVEINGTETWTLSNEGKTLTSQVHSTSPQGEFSVTAVYDKQ
jgi:hypothetical protein